MSDDAKPEIGTVAHVDGEPDIEDVEGADLEPAIPAAVHAVADPRAPLALDINEQDLAPVHDYIHNHLSLLAAFEHALQAAEDRAPLIDALQACFPHLVKGLGAHRAVALVPDAHDELEILAYTTTLRPVQLNSIQHGISVRGVSSSIIRKVLESREPAIVQHPTFLKPAERTGALNDYDYSVLCAPIVEPVRRRVAAILYLQSRGGLANAYRDDDLLFLMKYVSLLERLFDLRDRIIFSLLPPDQTLDELEPAFRKMIIEDRLRRHEYDYELTAASLGMHRVSLYRLFRVLGIKTKGRQLAELKDEAPTGTPIKGVEH